ncbi:hypothetical protein BpHYR1_032042 [Brachionus plicatilis]|uniref:Uncharacterized protein n=1 Tax=Brachionus plicatilis TaxID=10195 RepID=A0A3M7PRW8_BRAPC|nr:hypothetical protein BpHYR1_032042 [Brachionus plicatilis]
MKLFKSRKVSKNQKNMPLNNLGNEHSDDENLGKNDQSHNKNDERGRGRGRGRGGRGDNSKNIAQNETSKTKGGTQRGRKCGRLIIIKFLK